MFRAHQSFPVIYQMRFPWSFSNDPKNLGKLTAVSNYIRLNLLVFLSAQTHWNQKFVSTGERCQTLLVIKYGEHPNFKVKCLHQINRGTLGSLEDTHIPHVAREIKRT